MKNSVAEGITLNALVVVVSIDAAVLFQLGQAYWRHGMDGLKHYIAFVHLADHLRPRSQAELSHEAARGYYAFGVVFLVLFLVTWLAVWAYRRARTTAGWRGP